MDSAVVDSISALVERRPLPIPPLAEHGEADDDLQDGAAGIGYAEGQSFMIEYRDSKGRSSRRSITVYEIVLGRGDIPLLHARCHLRKMMRQFRVDRIACCIDYSGEVHDDVAVYLNDCFGMALNIAKRQVSEEQQRWSEIVDLIRSEAVLLAALGHCDGRFHPLESEFAVAHLALAIERCGTFVSDGDVERLAHFVARLRPTPAAIARALGVLETFGQDRVRRFLLAADGVINADGRLHVEEIALLNDIAKELTGVALH
jgi:hypothetical protein